MDYVRGSKTLFQSYENTIFKIAVTMHQTEKQMVVAVLEHSGYSYLMLAEPKIEKGTIQVYG